MVVIFGNLTETELTILESSIQFITDNDLNKKDHILKKVSCTWDP